MLAALAPRGNSTSSVRSGVGAVQATSIRNFAGMRVATRADSLALVPMPAYRGIGNCKPSAPAAIPCRMTATPSSADLERRLGSQRAVAWGGADSWHIAYRADDDSVTGVDVGGGVQLPMSPVVGTRLWTLSLHMPGADSGVVMLDLYVTKGKAVVRDTSAIREWRGALAAPPHQVASRLAGTVRIDSLWSDALKTYRGLTVYTPPGRRTERLPVVYLADGQNVRSYAPVIDPLIQSGKLPPVVLVGVWVSSGSPKGGPATGPNDDLRTIEYHEGVEQIPGSDSAFIVARYRGHKTLFTEEVRKWAEEKLHVSTDRRWRAVQGNSSGCHYALVLGRERPDLYGMVIGNSNGGVDAMATPAGGWGAAPRHFLSAGVLEPSLVRVQRAIGDSLTSHGVPNVVRVYPSGHDYNAWTESLPTALEWWLRDRKGS